MNTQEIAAEYRLSHWAQIMRERSESGQSIKGYCKNTGIHENTYYYWQRKLREATCERLKGIQGEGAETNLSVPRFTEVQMVEPGAVTAVSGAALTGQIHIGIKGIEINADSTYPAEKLGVLLRELTRTC